MRCPGRLLPLARFVVRCRPTEPRSLAARSSSQYALPGTASAPLLLVDRKRRRRRARANCRTLRSCSRRPRTRNPSSSPRSTGCSRTSSRPVLVQDHRWRVRTRALPHQMAPPHTCHCCEVVYSCITVALHIAYASLSRWHPRFLGASISPAMTCKMTAASDHTA